VNYWYIVRVMEIREQLIVGSVNTEDKKRSKLARSDRHACYCARGTREVMETPRFVVSSSQKVQHFLRRCPVSMGH
jgi:hypothetical protein